MEKNECTSACYDNYCPVHGIGRENAEATVEPVQKIWVVEQGEYSDYSVVGVFTSEANAQQIADLLNKSETYSKATVAEWVLDPAIEALRNGYSQYRVLMLEDGTVERCERKDLSSYDLAGKVQMWRRSQATAYRGIGVKDCMNAEVWAKNDQHAIKIVNEHRVQFIATGKWERDE